MGKKYLLRSEENARRVPKQYGSRREDEGSRGPTGKIGRTSEAVGRGRRGVAANMEDPGFQFPTAFTRTERIGDAGMSVKLFYALDAEEISGALLGRSQLPVIVVIEMEFEVAFFESQNRF